MNQRDDEELARQLTARTEALRADANKRATKLERRAQELSDQEDELRELADKFEAATEVGLHATGPEMFREKADTPDGDHAYADQLELEAAELREQATSRIQALRAEASELGREARDLERTATQLRKVAEPGKPEPRRYVASSVQEDTLDYMTNEQPYFEG